MRRRLDEAVAWEHEVSGGTYGVPRIRHALMRAGVDVGVWAVAASMRRLGLTGLNMRPRLARCGGRGPVAHEDHCARQWDQGATDRVWITDFTYLRCAHGWVYLCAVKGTVSMGQAAVCWDNAMAESLWATLTTEYSSPPATRSTQGSPPGSKTSTTAAASTPASAADPPSNTNDTKRPRQQAHQQTLNNVRTGPSEIAANRSSA